MMTHQAVDLPDTLDGYPASEIAEWKTEFDVTRALERLGHSCRLIGGFDEVSVIRRTLHDYKPHIVFNLLEEFRGEGVYVPFILGYLQLRRYPVTGCNPNGLMLADDKVLCKKILRYHRIPVPDFARVRHGRVTRRPRRLEFPLIVKSTSVHGSVGIAQASIVTSDEKLKERVDFIHDQIGTDALIERYVDGRELYQGVIGNRRLEVFPPWEMRFDRLPDAAPKIATEKVKWDLAYQKKTGITTGAAQNLPSAIVDRMGRMCKRVYRILGLTGYARMDFRLTEGGELFLLEPNPNPDLARDEDFAVSAESGGLDYDRLIQRVTNLGIRYGKGRR